MGPRIGKKRRVTGECGATSAAYLHLDLEPPSLEPEFPLCDPLCGGCSSRRRSTQLRTPGHDAAEDPLVSGPVGTDGQAPVVVVRRRAERDL